MAKRPVRTLSAADRAVWDSVARTVTRVPEAAERPAASAPPKAPKPLASKPVPQPPEPAHRVSAPAARPQAAARRAVEAEARVPFWRVERAPDPLDGLDPARGLDGRTAGRVRRGKRAPEARIDLHGMTADKAHSALAAFIRRSHAQGLRFVLVITGKGGRRRGPEDADWVPEGKGVLRHAAPRWLKQPPLDRLVTGVYSAHIRHGGEGALYVQLSKKR